MIKRPSNIDLSSCDKEPLAFINQVQAYGGLIICESEPWRVLQVSANIERFTGIPAAQWPGQPLAGMVPEAVSQWLVGFTRVEAPYGTYERPLHAESGLMPGEWTAHRMGERLYLEFSPFEGTDDPVREQELLSEALLAFQQVTDVPPLLETAAQSLKRLTGYDRVMVYRFDADWNGEVVAEAREPHLESFLGLHYPASDIPPKAREIYEKTWVRMIVDLSRPQENLLPQELPTGKPLPDLTPATVRAVSPVHIEYLTNMGVKATMSIAIMHEGKLWGLFALHHYQARRLSFSLRRGCTLLGRVLSGHLALILTNRALKEQGHLNQVREQLNQQLEDSQDVLEALVHMDSSLLDLIPAESVAIHLAGKWTLLGDAPPLPFLQRVLNWLTSRQQDEIFATSHLVGAWSHKANYHPEASGLLALEISHEAGDYLLWFRAEQEQSVNWAGNPAKHLRQTPDGFRLSPRKSFEKWTEKVKGHSQPWRPYELAAASTLRERLRNLMVRAHHHQKLQNLVLQEAIEDLKTFSFSVSHDLRAPLRNLNSFAHILQQEYSELLDHEGKELLGFLADSADRLQEMVKSLLLYTRISQRGPTFTPLDSQALIKEVLTFDFPTEQDKVEIMLPLPPALGDPTLVRQVWANLISNALKYSRHSQQPKVVISAEASKEGNEVRFWVQDNGIGMKQEAAKLVFEMFSRLVLDKEYEGTGIGLSIAKRIVEKHGGQIGLRSQPGQGAAFYFSLPAASSR